MAKEDDVPPHPLFASLLKTLHLHPSDFDQSIKDELPFEKILLETLHLHDLESLGLPLFLMPKMYRKLPRLYQKEHPKFSKVKGSFSDLAALKKLYLDKALLFLYKNVELGVNASITLLTYVLGDGLGDYYAQLEAANILKKNIPTLKISLLTLLPQKMNLQASSSFPTDIIYYTDSVPAPIPDDIYQKISSSDLILQIPTFYPHTQKLLDKVNDHPEPPKYELLGEFGLIDRGWYGPTQARCMGLHFLEKGIFIKKMPDITFQNLERIQEKKILLYLLGTKEPSAEDIASYRKTHRFNLNYTKTLQGNLIYLIALLKALEDDEKNIDICFSQMGHLIELLQNTLCKEGQYPLLKKYHVRNVFIHFKDFISEIPVATSGKTVRFIHLENIPHEDFLFLMTLTDDLVGCTGDGSVSEAISAKKVFFYDPPYHKRSFLKDLIALSQERYPLCGEFLKLCLHPSNPHFEDQFGAWVPEEDIKVIKKSDEEIGEELGRLLKDPKLHEAFYELGSYLQKEYAIEDTLCGIVRRSIIHRRNPEIETMETGVLNEFVQDKISAKQALQAIQERLSHSSNSSTAAPS